MTKTSSEAEPIAAKAAPELDPRFAFDRIAYRAQSWEEYYAILNKTTQRRHHSNPLFIRHEVEQWIEGQCATKVGSWTRRLVVNKEWRTEETHAYNLHLFTLIQEGERKYTIRKEKERAVRRKIRNQLRGNELEHRWFSFESKPNALFRKKFNHAEGQSLGQLMGMARLLKKKGVEAQALEHAWELRFRFAHFHVVTMLVENEFPEIVGAQLPNSSGVRTLMQVKSVCHTLAVKINQAERNGDVPFVLKANQLLRRHRSHFLHKSLEHPLMVAYAPSYAYFIKDRWIRTSLGRYLTKFFSEVLTEEEIRAEANRWNEANKPLDLHLVPNTKPDEWEWVYEHGKNFNSCMTLSRKDRVYINEYARHWHPVRAYACDHPDNHLALAYIGEPGSEVWARSIVNTHHKTYLRIYGDDRLKSVLIREGFRCDPSKTMLNEVMQAEKFRPGEAGYEDYFILPYLDAGAYERISADSSLVKVTPTGATASSEAVAVLFTPIMVECADCATEFKWYKGGKGSPQGIEINDGLTLRYVCNSCLSNLYVYAYVDTRGNMGYRKRDDCVHNVSNGENYLRTLVDTCGLILHEGLYWNKNSLVFLAGENVHVLKRDAHRLSIPTKVNGKTQDYARQADTMMTFDGRTIHQQDAVECPVSGAVMHPEEAMQVGEMRIHSSALIGTPWKFGVMRSVVGERATILVTYDPAVQPEFDASLAGYLTERGMSSDLLNTRIEGLKGGSYSFSPHDILSAAIRIAAREKRNREDRAAEATRQKEVMAALAVELPQVVTHELRA